MHSYQNFQDKRNFVENHNQKQKKGSTKGFKEIFNIEISR